MKQQTAIVLGVVVGGLLVLRAQRAGATLIEAITPTHPENIVYQGFNAVGDILDDGTDNNSYRLGNWLYGKLNPGQRTHMPVYEDY